MDFGQKSQKWPTFREYRLTEEVPRVPEKVIYRVPPNCYFFYDFW